MKRLKVVAAGLAVLAVGGVAVSGALITLGTPVPLVPPLAGYGSAIADVTGDGNGDVIVAAAGSAATVSVFPGNGDGTFGERFDVTLSSQQYVTRVRTAWLNGDAAQDIVVAHANTAALDVYLSDGAGGFARTSFAPVPATSARNFALVDWDRDGDVDIVSNDMNGGAVHLRRNYAFGGGAWSDSEEPVAISGAMKNIQPASCVASDLDGDGDLDLASNMSGSIFIYWRQADLTLLADDTVLSSGAAGAINGLTMLASDVDGDGASDLVAVTSKFPPAQVIVFRHLTPTTFAVPVTYTVAESGINEWDLAAADLNGDGRPEIVTPSNLLVNAGDGTFGEAIPLVAASSVAVGNVDQDAHPDIAVTRYITDVQVFPVQTDGPAPPPVIDLMSPGFLSIGTTSDVLILGSSFQPGITAEFGDGVTVNSLVRDSLSKLRANVTVTAASAILHGNLRLTNPDSATTTHAYPIFIGGASVLEKLIPAEAHAGDILDVIVEGFAFKGESATTAALGAGVTVTSVEVLDTATLRLKVNVALGASLGARDLTVRNGLGATSVAKDAFTILPARSLDIVAESGRLVTSPRSRKGSFRARGSIAFNSFSADGTFTPATEGAEIRFGSPSAPVILRFPADAGWKVRGKKATWKSRKGAKPFVAVEFDLAKGTFRMDVQNATVPPQASTEVLVEATLGDETGLSVRRWSRVRGSGGRVLVLK